MSSKKNSTGYENDDYEAPTVGYKDVLYTHGTTKVAATFEQVTTKIRRFIALQTWKSVTIAGQGIDTTNDRSLLSP